MKTKSHLISALLVSCFAMANSAWAEEICPLTGLPKDGSMSTTHSNVEKGYGPTKGIKLGTQAPNHLGKTLKKKDVYLEDKRGKLVVLSFWDANCQYCVNDLSILDNIQRQVGRDKLEVVAINMHTPVRTFKKIAKQLKGYQITMLHDRRDKVSKSYGVGTTPYLAVIDSQGEVAITHADYSAPAVNALIPQLQDLLNKSSEELADR